MICDRTRSVTGGEYWNIDLPISGIYVFEEQAEREARVNIDWLRSGLV